MRRGLTVLLVLFLVIGVALAIVVRVGLPMRALLPPPGAPVGAVSGVARDPSRPDIFSGAAQRVVPFQMLYPAKAPGNPAFYMPDAGPSIAAIAKSHGWISRLVLGQIGGLPAPWTEAAEPAAGGPFPVIISLPGVTGYMQMGSFQTSALAAQGYVVVTLNQPGAVAAARLPDLAIVAGLTRDDAGALIRPSYLPTGQALPESFAARLAPEQSIIPYFAADVPLVLDRLAQINADPAQALHGVLDLGNVGVMGLSLGAIVAAQACAAEARIGACLMMDAPVPREVAARGLRQPALWISRPEDDQRKERAASGGWPEAEIAAQARSIDLALSNSTQGRVVLLPGLFHLDFTDLPAIQPLVGWIGQSGPLGAAEAHRQINQLTATFFATSLGGP